MKGGLGGLGVWPLWAGSGLGGSRTGVWRVISY